MCSKLSVGMPIVLPNANIQYSYIAVMESRDLLSVSKATGLGHKPIVLRLWISKGHD